MLRLFFLIQAQTDTNFPVCLSVYLQHEASPVYKKQTSSGPPGSMVAPAVAGTCVKQREPLHAGRGVCVSTESTWTLSESLMDQAAISRWVIIQKVSD